MTPATRPRTVRRYLVAGILVWLPILAVVWVIVASRTVRGAWRGDLFVAPCLKDERGGRHRLET